MNIEQEIEKRAKEVALLTVFYKSLNHIGHDFYVPVDILGIGYINRQKP